LPMPNKSRYSVSAVFPVAVDQWHGNKTTVIQEHSETANSAKAVALSPCGD